MVPLGDEAQVEAHFGLSDILLILTQDRWAQLEARFGLSDMVLILTQERCMVCVKRTIGLQIILDAPNGTPR